MDAETIKKVERAIENLGNKKSRIYEETQFCKVKLICKLLALLNVFIINL